MLLTTQVTLSDEVIRVKFPLFFFYVATKLTAISQTLIKLGVKMTSRPSECTHLLAPQLVRTEKFLCALVVAPFILTEKWATRSAAVKKLLRAFLRLIFVCVGSLTSFLQPRKVSHYMIAWVKTSMELI